MFASSISHWSAHKDDFFCCPVAGRPWEAAGVGELGCTLPWVLLSVCDTCDRAAHAYPARWHTRHMGSTPGPVMEKGSWWEPSECLHVLCTIPEATGEQKSTMKATQDCSRWKNKHSWSWKTSPADWLPPTDQCGVQCFLGDSHWLCFWKVRSSLLPALIWELAVKRNGRVMANPGH